MRGCAGATFSPFTKRSMRQSLPLETPGGMWVQPEAAGKKSDESRANASCDKNKPPCDTWTISLNKATVSEIVRLCAHLEEKCRKRLLPLPSSS